MSEPVSNNEIEDVLSSIRQLISDNKPQENRGGSAIVEKLVLTAACRVHDAPAPVGAAVSSGQKKDQNLHVVTTEKSELARQSEGQPLSAHAAEIEVAVQGDIAESNRDGWEPDGGETAEQSDVLQFHAARTNDTSPQGRSNTPVHETPAQDLAEVSEIVSDDIDIIDEEIIRRMVSEMVRDELRGDVGEKITHSIRRFIRSEIARAIALEKLD